MNIRSSSVLKNLSLLMLVIAALYLARAFLIPVSISTLLAMLLLPFCRWLERKGIGRGWAAFFSMLILVLFAAGIGTMVGWQVMHMSQDFALLKEKISGILNDVCNFIFNNSGISITSESLRDEGSSMVSFIGNFAGLLIQLLTYFILMLVYVLFLLYYRDHLKAFLLRLVSDERKEEVGKVIKNIAQISQQYLVGLSKMIVLLWIMYGIGFSIIGVKNALFFAILCGLLEIVPFIGNITGTSLTILFSAIQGAGFPMLLSIAITYGVIQFIQGWVLEPLILGPQVRVNPLFTIIALVIGEMVWGIPGVFLAIPLMAMFKIVCDHIEALKPLGFLIGETKTVRQELQVVSRFRSWFGKKE